MSRIRPAALALFAALTLNAQPHAQVAPARASTGLERCTALAAMRVPDVRLSEERYAIADPAATGPVHAAHCRATGVIGREIGFTIWLPDQWDGRVLMVGGGGYVGSIPGPGTGVDRGFAVASTDTGHQSDGTDASWALQNLERQVNFAYLAV